MLRRWNARIVYVAVGALLVAIGLPLPSSAEQDRLIVADSSIRLDSVTLEDFDDSGVMRTVVVIERPDATEAYVESSVVGCFQIMPSFTSALQTMEAAPSVGCSGTTTPALPEIQYIGGARAFEGPCGTAVWCWANLVFVRVEGLWGGTVTVTKRDVNMPDSVSVSFPPDTYNSIFFKLKVKTSITSMYSLDVQIVGEDGGINDQRHLTVDVVEQGTQFELLDAVRTSGSVGGDGYAAGAIGHVLPKTVSCLAPQPSGRPQTASTSFNVYAGYLTDPAGSFGLGPDCDDLVSMREVRLV